VYLFEGLKSKLGEYLPQEHVELVQASYVLARDAHEGQTRSSGDPYITHPVAVSGILADMRLDYESLMAALLHDVIEDTEYSKEDLALAFGDTVAEIVEGVSKLDKLKFSSKQEAQAENFRKMLMAMVQDIRVILIKLADRTHNMRTLGSLRADKRRRIALETLEIYAPMAHYGFRIIVDSIDNCYRAFGAIHGLYKPIENRFKDYIAIPRSNGYQSLHTSLKGPHGIPVEVQIRTEEMDHLADKGVAAHWLYKESDKDKIGSSAQLRANRWMESLVELQKNASTSVEFIETVKSDLFPDEIYVFTPRGKIIELPTGATAVDFAYAVHTDVGNTCVGARVDNRNYSLSKPLQNGQGVEIITSPRAKPNANWLNFVVSARARSSIRHFLKRQHANDATNMGNRLLRHALGTIKLDEIPQEDIDRVVKETHCKSFDELLSKIGMGNEISAIIARRIVGENTLTAAIARCNSSITNLQTEDREDNHFVIDIELTTKNRTHLANIMRKIRVLPELQSISRHSR